MSKKAAPALMNKKDVQKIVRNAEADFKLCWETIAELKYEGPKDTVTNEIIEFQPRLAKAMYFLEHTYNRLRAEEKALTKKVRLNHKARLQRLILSKAYRHALDQAIDLGKILGDAFAWIFYQNERKLLKKHYQREPILHFATGTGGQGEITFIEKAPKFGNYLVLYHGTTTFLRLGDISLIDLEQVKVVAIGELKSHKLSESEIGVTVNLIGPKLDKSILPKAEVRTDAHPKMPQMKPEQLARFQRQVTAIENSFKPKITVPIGVEPALCVDWNTDKLDALYDLSDTRRFRYVKADRGLLLVGLKMSWRSLWATLLSGKKTEFTKKMAGTQIGAREIVDKNIQDNSITIGFLPYAAEKRYNLKQGMRPLFWWPLKRKTVESLIFRRFIVTTFFNPAFLIQDLRQSGFAVTCENGSLATITKQFRGQLLSFAGFSHFIEFIKHYLFPESAVATLIHRTVDTLNGKSFKLPAVVHLDLNFSFE